MTVKDILEANLERIKDGDSLKTSYYFNRLAEAVEHGVFMDENILENNLNLSMQLLAKSKYMLLHNSAWATIIGSAAWANILDPITNYDLALDGKLGKALGCDLITDGFMTPHLKDSSEETKGKVIFVLHDAFKEFWNDELKQFVI